MRRFLTALVAATVTAAAFPTTSGAEDQAVVGEWDSFDPSDGSYQTLAIRRPGHADLRVELRDSGASACGTDASGTPLFAAVGKGPGQVSGTTLTATLRVRCVGRDAPDLGLFEAEFTYDPASDTLGEPGSPGAVWHRVDRAAEPLTLYTNGTVVTMSPDRPSAEAVATRRGILVAVGSTRQIRALREPTTVEIELEGRALLPGFIDSHAHWIGDRELNGWVTAQEAIDAALSNGFTTVSELFVNQDRLDELVALDAAGELPIRVRMFLPVNYHDDKFGVWFGAYSPGQEFSDHLKIAGVKAFVDRANPAFMYLSEEYADRPGYFGHASWTQAELDAMVAELHTAGWQVAIHTSGDAAHDMVLDAFDAALAGDSNDLHRHRIEHVVLLRDDQVERMRDLGLIASFQLTWFNSDWLGHEFWGPYESTLGPDRLAWIGRWRDLLDAGVTSIGGTDTPWTPAGTMQALHEAVTRIGESGAPPAPWMLDQRITIEEAVRLVTADAAYGSFDEDVIGTIEPGKYADLVILSADPLSEPTGGLPDIDVLTTIVGGHPAYCAPSFPTPCHGG